ncbi:cytochrome oxidase c assembly-domain-containing protein [Parachaetomium inaequale]|uniref:Cytochrome oxidase c assembly-domain-containing protein n=1 Tax=Parachaetomium inaequale TaxID=2588326 RepID=A0AAN6P7R9_9PEZI|nr:cytochrome oxidase c assembly-domain-containing protein [Parachaetomium inaequale]
MKPTLRLCAAPRSVSDATRFTATTLHASSKTATPPPRFAPSKSGPVPPAPGGGGGKAGPSALFETPEQKVARLRAAHQRAKAAQVSKFDKVVDASRRVFDSAHKVTVAGLIGFTVIAGLLTAYTAVDMIMYNKKRSAEWVEAQMKLEADSLEAARIAYMTGKADEEQIALVEEQLERERESGRKTSFFSNISVLGAPEAPGAAADKSSSSASSSTPPPQAATPGSSTTETVAWPPKADSATTESSETSPQEQKATGLWSWLTSNLKREEEPSSESTPMSPQRRLGYEALSEEDDGAGVRESDIVRAVEDKQAQLKAKAHAALEKEKERQRTGGPLDRVGVEKGETGEKGVDGEKGKKKGWFW